MKLSSSEKIEILKNIIENIEWLLDDIPDFENFKQGYYDFDETIYNSDVDYKKRLDECFEKTVLKKTYKNAIIDDIIQIAIKSLLKTV